MGLIYVGASSNQWVLLDASSHQWNSWLKLVFTSGLLPTLPVVRVCPTLHLSGVAGMVLGLAAAMHKGILLSELCLTTFNVGLLIEASGIAQ